MIRMSAVWDRTVEVLGGRAGILAAIALVTIALPSVVQGALAGDASTRGGSMAAAANLIGVALALWGTLAITAVASDPAIDQGRGLRIGGRAIPRTLLVTLVLGLLGLVLAIPGVVLLMRSGYDLAAAQRGDQVAALANAELGPFLIYAIVLGVLLIWLAARLALTYPVLVNEPLGLGAIRRSFALTRGLAVRIVGVLILYLIVLAVALTATQLVFGSVFRLLLGDGQTMLVAVLTAAAVALVTAFFSVLQVVFATQLYVAARGVPVAPPMPDPVVRTGPWA